MWYQRWSLMRSASSTGAEVYGRPVHGRALPLALVALAGFVPTAHATLVYEKGFVNGQRPTIWVAGDDGSAARRVAIGENPRVSADGQTLVYGTQYIRSSRPKLMKNDNGSRTATGFGKC